MATSHLSLSYFPLRSHSRWELRPLNLLTSLKIVTTELVSDDRHFVANLSRAGTTQWTSVPAALC